MVNWQLAKTRAPMQAAWLSTFVADFIHEQKAQFVRCCKPLRAQHLERMSPHFSAQELERVRFRNIYPDRVPNPSFYAGLQAVGVRGLPDLGQRKAATFDNVIVTHEPFTPALLFEELVRVVQFRLLGVEGYADFYVQALLAGCSYGSTPLDLCVSDLGARFINASGPIDVESEVRRWLAEGRFGMFVNRSSHRGSWRTAVASRWQACATLCRSSLQVGRSSGMQSSGRASAK